VPLICTGSVLGRLIGELIHLVFPHGVGTGGVPIHAGVCATVGAAAMLTGSTHCLSSAVIVFELTGQLNLLSPLLVGTITAYYIAKPLSLNIWDQITVRKGLPFLPDITPTVASYLKRVSQFTNREIYCLPKDVTREEAAKFLQDCPRDTIPIVDTRGTPRTAASALILIRILIRILILIPIPHRIAPPQRISISLERPTRPTSKRGFTMRT